MEDTRLISIWTGGTLGEKKEIKYYQRLKVSMSSTAMQQISKFLRRLGLRAPWQVWGTGALVSSLLPEYEHLDSSSHVCGTFKFY